MEYKTLEDEAKSPEFRRRALRNTAMDIAGNVLKYTSLLAGVHSVMGEQVDYRTAALAGAGFVVGKILNRFYEDNHFDWIAERVEMKREK